FGHSGTRALHGESHDGSPPGKAQRQYSRKCHSCPRCDWLNAAAEVGTAGNETCRNRRKTRIRAITFRSCSAPPAGVFVSNHRPVRKVVVQFHKKNDPSVQNRTSLGSAQSLC